MKIAKSNRRIWFLFTLTACGTLGFFIAPDFWFSYTHKKLASKKMQEIFPGDSREILESAGEVTLFSLNGSLNYRASKNSQPGQFHGYPILGQTVIEGKTKYRLMAEIYNGLATGDFRGACFNPHHGVRASVRGRTVDCLICFSCWHFLLYSPNGETATIISKAPEKFFNQLLESANVPFDPTYKH